MGLDVYLRRDLTGKKKSDMSDEDWDSGNWFNNFVLTPKWENRNADLEQDMWYEYKFSDDVVGYPYSSHSAFRQTLADIAHDGMKWNDVAQGDFYEFIDFADNEGTITWTMAGKLAKDFRKWEKVYMAMNKDERWNRDRYTAWMEGFESCAVEKGVIEYR